MVSETIDQLADDARELAALASLTARVDRVVLRALRLAVMPGASATAESDLWFSDVVSRRSANEIVLATEMLAPLRAMLVASGRVGAAREVVFASHAGASPLLALEDKLIFLGLTGAEDDVEAALGEALVTLRSQPGRALDIAGWALRALPRLPEAVRKTAAAWSLAFAAEAECGYLVPLGDGAPEDALVVDPSVGTTTIGVTRSGDHLLLGSVEGARLPVAATTPRIVTVEVGADKQVVAVPPDHVCSVKVAEGDVVLTNLFGERWAVRAVVKEQATRGTVRYLVLSGLRLSLDNERAISAQLFRVVRDLHEDRWIPDLVFVVGDLTDPQRERTPEGVAWISDNMNQLDRQLGEISPGPRFLVLGQTEFDGTAQDRAREAIRIDLGQTRRDTGERLSIDQHEREARRSGLLPGDQASTEVIRGMRVGILTVNTSLVGDGTRAPSIHQLAETCGGDRIDWAARHDLTLLVADQPGPMWDARAAREIDDIADVTVYPREPRGDILVPLVAGAEVLTGYRRGEIEVDGNRFRISERARMWTGERFIDDRRQENVLVRRHRPRGERARQVRTLADGLRRGGSYLLVGPAGSGLEYLLREVEGRLGTEVDTPQIPPASEDQGDGSPSTHGAGQRRLQAVARFEHLTTIDALARFRASREQNLEGAVLAALAPLPFPAADLAKQTGLEQVSADDLAVQDIADALAGDTARAEAIYRVTQGHAAATLEVIEALRAQPSLDPEQAGRMAIARWPPDISYLGDAGALLRCLHQKRYALAAASRRNEAKPPTNRVTWELWRAGLFRFRHGSAHPHWLKDSGITPEEVRAHLRALVPPPSNRVVVVSTGGRELAGTSALVLAEELGTYIALSGWQLALDGRSTFDLAVQKAFTDLVGDSRVHASIGNDDRPFTFGAEIAIGADGRNDQARRQDVPLLRLRHDEHQAIASNITKRQVADLLARVDGMRTIDQLLDELGVMAADGVVLAPQSSYSGSDTQAWNAIEPGKRTKVLLAERALLKAVGAVVANAYPEPGGPPRRAA